MNYILKFKLLNFQKKNGIRYSYEVRVGKYFVARTQKE